MSDHKIPCDSEAVVFAEDSIIINSDPDRIMSILTDISHWTNWRKAISKVKLMTTDIKEGTDFKWSAGGVRYHSSVHTLSNTHFGWTGKTIGAYAVHNWSVEKLSATESKVIVQESLNGWLMSMLRKQMKEELPKLLRKDLQELKEECEQRNR